MKRIRLLPVALPAGAVLVEAGGFLLLTVIYSSAYGGTGGPATGATFTLTCAVLALGGALGGALAVGGSYMLMSRSRLPVAIPATALVCAPATLGAVTYLYALLVFLALV